MRDKAKLPKPLCRYGYTQQQLKRYFTERRWSQFEHWMRGQTGAVCAGPTGLPTREGDKRPQCAKAHGLIIYECDVQQFLRGGDTLD